MQLSVLLGLAVLWIVVLLPDVLRRRSYRRPTDSISSFSAHLSVLESSQRRAVRREGGLVGIGPLTRPQVASRPARPVPATRVANPQQRPAGGGPRRSGAQQRRQDVIVSLLAASLLSFLAMLTFSGAFLILHIVIDLALVAYVAAVLTITRRTQTRSKVTSLARARMERMPNRMVPVAAQSRRSAIR